MQQDPKDFALPHEQVDEPERGRPRRRRQLGAVALAAAVGIAALAGILATVAYQWLVNGIVWTWGTITFVPGVGPVSAFGFGNALVAGQTIPFLITSLVLTLRLPGRAPRSHLGALAAVVLWLLPVYFPFVPGSRPGSSTVTEWLFYVSIPLVGGLVGGVIGDAWRHRLPARGSGVAWEAAASVLLPPALLTFVAHSVGLMPLEAGWTCVVAALSGGLVVALARGEQRALAWTFLGAAAAAALTPLTIPGGGVPYLWSPLLGPIVMLLSAYATRALWQAVARRRLRAWVRNLDRS